MLALSDGSEKYIRTDSPSLESTTLCSRTQKFGEFGVYDLNINNCSFDVLLEPVNENLALLVCFMFYVGLAFLCIGAKFIPGKPVHKFERLMGWRDDKTGAGKPRLRSLDTFRGISLAIMIFVNDGGGMYWFFEHATWNGLCVADLVFPWFLWIMGVCIPMSVRSNLRRKVSLSTVVWQISVRSVKLFLLGFILNTLGGWIDLERLRVPGVLQRFGVAYFVVAVVANVVAILTNSESEPSSSETKPGTTESNNNESKSGRSPSKPGLFTDLKDLAPQWFIMSAILFAHQLIIWLVAAPGCPQGYRGPGGLHDWSPERNNSGCIGGITGYIDKAFFSTAHIYGNPTARSVYKASEFDPEGILGSLTTIFQVWLGYQAGYILQVYPDCKNRVSRLFIWSICTGIISAILCGGEQNGGWVPINKNLWSISYVMVTSCFAFALLAFLYIVIDKKHWWKGQPFFYPGMNSILLYCGHSVAYNLFPFHFISGEMRTHAARLPEALWGTTLWIFISFVLYKKKVFVTV